jgi:hypothetical protein
VHVDTSDVKAWQFRSLRIQRPCRTERDAELVLGAAGRDLGMGPLPAAMADSSSNSASDSRLTQRMFSSTAKVSSAAVLPIPENIILSRGTPAASARLSSPPDTTSAPAPSFAKVAITAWFEFALTA